MLKILYSKLDDEDLIDLKHYGFCLMIYEYFGLTYGAFNMEILFPELYAYKPANRPNDSCWWFPIGGEQTERLEIAQKILKSLQEQQ